MQVRDIIRAVRTRWRLVLTTVLIFVALSALTTWLMPREYAATSQVFVSTSGGSGDSNELLQGSSFSQQRVKSYAEVLRSPLVLGPVIESLGLETSPQALGTSITTMIPLDTVLIEVTAESDNPQQAAAIANAVSNEFIRVVPTVESANERQSPVKVTLTREATAPETPISPRPGINLMLGLLLGLMSGLGLAVARHRLDTTIKGETDVKAVTDEVIIGGIHFSRDTKTTPLIVHGDPHSPRAESFRTLRTNLQFVDAAHPAKSIVFTSSVPGEGKSTTTANLALAMGESGARVCIVEADLRRPRMVEYMGLASGAGLTNLIIDEVDYEDVLQPFGAGTNVTVLGAGPIPPNPSELLGSPAMGEIVKKLEEAFDFVVFDAPPLLPVTDAAVLSRLVGGVVVVVGADVARKDQLRKTMELLGNVGAEVLGIVINRLPAKGSDTYSYYREGYAPHPVFDPSAPRSSARGRRNGSDRKRARA